MTRRGVLTLLLGIAIYAVAWLFGAKALYPVALGLVLAPIVARTWVRLAARPIALKRRIGGGLLGRRASGGHLFEGEDVWVTLEAQPEARVPLPSISVTERIAKLGERHTPLQRAGGPYRGTYVIEKVSRGRYDVEEARATIDDPFGLARSEVDLAAAGSLLVYPRLVALDRLFSESGAHAQDGRRLLLRRPSGFDLHSVREYEQGESLRKVHWRTTARRGQLMVKELEDSPREDVAVILDAWRGCPRPVFDMAVRAAGSILQAHATRGRPATFVSTGRERAVVPVRSAADDLGGAVTALAAAEPDALYGLARFLGSDHPAVAGGGEVLVVTATREPAAFAAVLALAGRRVVSVVWVDAASFAARPTRAEAGVLRLAAHGIPAAVVRRGDDLADELSAPRLRAVRRA